MVPGGQGRAGGRGQSREGRCQVSSLPAAQQATSSPRGKVAGRIISPVWVSTAARKRGGSAAPAWEFGRGGLEGGTKGGQGERRGATSPRARPSSTVGSGTLSGSRHCRPSEPPTVWCRRRLQQARSHGTAAHQAGPHRLSRRSSFPPASPCLASPSHPTSALSDPFSFSYRKNLSFYCSICSSLSRYFLLPTKHTYYFL